MISCPTLPIRCVLALWCAVLAFDAAGRSVAAQSCDAAENVTADLWAHAAEVSTDLGCTLLREYAEGGGEPYRDFRNAQPQCWAADVHALMVQEMVSYWNYRAGNNWATIGPRRLDLGEPETGRLVSTGGRMFITPAPVRERRVRITIEELDGRGETGVVVCRVDQDNERTEVRRVWFNDTGARKRDGSERREIVVRGARNSIITVHLDGKSVANTFRYRIRAE